MTLHYICTLQSPICTSLYKPLTVLVHSHPLEADPVGLPVAHPDIADVLLPSRDTPRESAAIRDAVDLGDEGAEGVLLHIDVEYLGILLLVALDGLQERGTLPGHHVADEGLALEGVLADLDAEDDVALSDDSHFAHGGLAVLEALEVSDVLRGEVHECGYDGGGDGHVVAPAAVGPLQRDQPPRHLLLRRHEAG